MTNTEFVKPCARPALELRNITAGYGRASVLHEVTLVVPSGKTAALLGPNGAGKSTALRVASGLRPVRSGQVLIDGRSMTHALPFERSRAGLCLVPEGAGIFPSLTVRENLRLQILPGLHHRSFEPAFDLFPILKDRLKQIAGTMSGGEQRMLALARCFLSDPKVVLVDELSAGLAPRVIETLFDALVRLTRNGVGLLVAEQRVARTLAIADVAYVLARGRIMRSGIPSALDLRELSSPFETER